MNTTKTRLSFAFLVICVTTTAAQDSASVVTDTAFMNPIDSIQLTDSIHYYDDGSYDTDDDEEEHADLLNDSANVDLRKIDSAVIQDLKNDPDMNFDTDSPAVSSVWDRFQAWLRSLFNSLFSWGEYTDWGQFFTFLFIIILLSFVMLKLLRVDALKMFYGAPKTHTAQYAVLDENIHEMNFEKLIQDALQKKEFRLAIRLTFLQSLKMLADHHHIYWEPGKTNHDYLRELKTTTLKSGFAQLNYYFEYAWYGNFKISQDTFNHVSDLFNKWKVNIR
jgi:Domain of unknown function (DUF4129)